MTKTTNGCEVSFQTVIKPHLSHICCLETRNSVAIVPFTVPVLSTGKEPSRVPRGASKYDEIAKNNWFIEFHFYDNLEGKMVRFRLSKQLNRIKEYHEKLNAFLQLQAKCTDDLRNGWNPLGNRAVRLTKPTKELMLVDA